MGLWGKLVGRLDRDGFALEMLSMLRAADGTAELDEEAFAVRSPQRTLFLANGWAEYEQARGRGARRRVLERVRASVAESGRPLPETFDEARPLLRPVVREVSYLSHLDLLARAEGKPSAAPPALPLGAHLMVTVAVDMPTSMATVSQFVLDGWKVGFDELLEEARRNLGRVSHAAWPECRPGVRLAPFTDSYAASRVALPHVVSRLDVQGKPVALVLERDLLAVSGADDERGLVELAAFAAENADLPRALSALPVRLEGERWVAHELPASHPAAPAFARLRYRAIGGQYELQRPVLQRIVGDDVYVSEIVIYRHREGSMFSTAAMITGVPALLPVVDRVHVVPMSDTSGGEIIATVPWAAAVGRARLTVEPDLDPIRYRFDGKLDSADLEALRAAGLPRPEG